MWPFKKKPKPEKAVYKVPHYSHRIQQAQIRHLGQVKSSETWVRMEYRLSYLPETISSEDKALEVLGMTKPFTQRQLRARRAKMLKQVHPDKGGSEMMVRMVEDAYNLLKK